ncbi:galactose-1-phosphate uridylyltransferase [Alkalihalobacillus alcalophilus ATCC 27647 = CGMCC 1.3604]|uniref:Galactose-1-phosphate uridylyltransferase n=1 Tax=Alkalihalobacillus alcalophilus ATCC 27647 = CGMCC 1.3604 TaxID=1218173 RepID=A0A094YU38_ALKAL|nr:UDP-glucose--hexose-1-phosphate uridylyltransferase [Alkalihalobacillus alcalophilus]KGA97002.1 galactose-1-phosphate uridylyltransferase [Alkalihalobacillus alcalophilus ATCC 27647 = CGMCC 1.3604]MED1564191.1 UDP-glucose--hexose-1-phosphate uridylyltransferase [Alkalihalobacillus alcalophilus]THG90255.1 galactose-1-phosphate uridylyltransferase [Alkalihalobacillus alcalophilus ATCC 27647 = CGMCC 1.3604]
MNVNIYENIERLLLYGLKKELISQWDLDYSRNQILHVLRLDDRQAAPSIREVPETPIEILAEMTKWALEKDVIEKDDITYHDRFDTKIMGCIAPRPSEVISHFYTLYQKVSPMAATRFYYKFSKDIHYVRTDRISQNKKWDVHTEYGTLEVTINLPKPEKGSSPIVVDKQLTGNHYPTCLLCKENVGFAGKANHPARQNLRIIPLRLSGEQWYLQFSPYIYYNEHVVVFSEEHQPMNISRKTFVRLLEFVEKFPHYFLGSNADLPIVGGSILSHDHYQGGNYDFPMAKASSEYSFDLRKYPDLKAEIIKWPMSVIRLRGKHRAQLVEAADDILTGWKQYEDPEAEIYAYTGDSPHNTITPIARRKGELFELDLVLRNNRTTNEHPEGLFHVPAEFHSIKKENIGLIEAMGLAVLPGRLSLELDALAEVLPSELAEIHIRENESIAKHLHWALKIKEKHPQLSKDNVSVILEEEVGEVFISILESAGVFKRHEKGRAAFRRFIDSIQS